VIYVQFGKDLFNISKVIGRKKVAHFILTHSVYIKIDKPNIRQSTQIPFC